MKTFKEYFEDMETRVERIALLPGGFKPPTKGHFNALRYLLDDADKGVVFIGGKERDGITPEQSEAIWEVYSKYFSKPVSVFNVPNPVRSNTDIGFFLPEDTRATITLINNLGQEFLILDKAYTGGYHSVSLDRKDLLCLYLFA